MNRNTQAHFAQIPSMDIARSKFDRSFKHITTCNLGELVPVYVDPDIVPGDTVTMKMADLIRMTTPITPAMDDLKADFFWFFIPNRLVWEHWKAMMGENDTAPWINNTDYVVPQLKILNTNTGPGSKLTNTILKGSVLDHMGIPTNYSWKKNGVDDEPTREIDISALPARAYAMVWNEFFRSEALQNPVYIPKGDTNENVVNENTSGYIADSEAYQTSYAYRGGLPCLKVCKTFDYFTAGLPQPQAGKDVTLPMNGTAPIKTKTFEAEYEGETYTYGENSKDLYVWSGLSGAGDVSRLADEISTNSSEDWIDTNDVNGKLYADLSQATGATINQLRTAFAIQKWQEREARGGQRYTEMIQSHFRTTNPDFRLQRPEYLGGYTHQISMNQVLSNAETANSPLGETGAYSLTTHRNGDVFSHSFTEHGILLCLMAIRQNSHTYQQGINRAWFKKERFDWYTPEFANLGETYITQDELYAQGTSEDKDAFAYQERWAEMRYMPDMVSGEMRSDYPTSLDIWHYADYYEEKPTLGNKWIKETDANLKRTLAVQDQDEFKVDLYFGGIYTRPLPMFSVPGLLDHH